MAEEIVVVSGLPRSGTSLLMQMLDRGGVEAASDGLRSSDEDNPRGYYEFEPVKRLQQDAAWMPQMRGKAVKVISQLLFSLPATERYAVIIMRRDLEEVLSSQEAMLTRQGRASVARETLRRAFTTHLERLEAWLPQQSNVRTLERNYKDVVAQPQQAAEQLNDFLGGRLDVAAMAAAVDAGLYRNRTS